MRSAMLPAEVQYHAALAYVPHLEVAYVGGLSPHLSVDYSLSLATFFDSGGVGGAGKKKYGDIISHLHMLSCEGS